MICRILIGISGEMFFVDVQNSCQVREPRVVHCGKRTVLAPVVRMLWKMRPRPGGGRSQGSFHFGSPCGPLSSGLCFRGSRWQLGEKGMDSLLYSLLMGAQRKGGGGAESDDATFLRPDT